MTEKSRLYSRHDPNVKTCPRCHRVVANAQRVCPNCDHEFYPSKADLPPE